MSEHIRRHSDHLRARKYTANFVDDNLMATIDMVNELAVHIEKLQERLDRLEQRLDGFYSHPSNQKSPFEPPYVVTCETNPPSV